MEKWTMKYGQIWSERREGKGEDAEPLTIQYETNHPWGVMGVMDGMGGSGSTVRKLPDGTSHTDAYLASRFIREKVLQWFEENQPNEIVAGEKQMELQEYLADELDKYKDELGIQPSGLQGNMTRVLPTTLALIHWVVKANEGLFVNSIWSGDSRNYVLDENGLRLLTRDNVVGKMDAFDSLYEDPPMDNFISQSKTFVLDNQVDAMRIPSILISCTDGCFNYLPSPMHFEQMLVETFIEASTMVDWMDKIKERLSPIAGDDFSMAVLLNKSQWDELKVVLKKRLENIEAGFIEPYDGLISLLNNIPYMQRILWRQYADENFCRLFSAKRKAQLAHQDAIENLYNHYSKIENGEEDGTE